VEFPLYGKFRKTSLSKEEMLSIGEEIGQRVDFAVQTGEGVEDVRTDANGSFRVVTAKGQYRVFSVILALGRSGTPRKLGVKGEELSKVLYRLTEAEAYTGRNIPVVGGGDSAIEAAMGLADQKGNKVTLSYRCDSFSRIK
jgi:thioredoxin reductase (NADPH)